jgi:uncharacterized protein YcbX
MSSGLRVSDLYIYPLKSAAGTSVASATLDRLGFAGDRRWMVVDARRRFLSQREQSSMALLRPAITSAGLELTFPGLDPLVVTTPTDDAPRTTVTVWDDTCEARQSGDEASAWISRALGVDCLLVHCPPGFQRAVDRTYASRNEHVSFADAFPLLVIGQGSLDDLNTRLETAGKEAVPMNRFRPNIVIEGGEPFAEDEWRRVRIGEGADAVELDLVKPCARCAIVPVDQATGVRGKEPLALLSSFRRRDSKVYFGQNALHRTLGTIRAGAPVTLVEG